MKNRILLLISAVLAFAGCAEMAPADAPPSRPLVTASPQLHNIYSCQGTCDIDVFVSKTATGCQVDGVSADHVMVNPGSQPTIIKWTIRPLGNGFRFASPGIAFDKGPPPDPGIMQNGNGGASVATVTDKHPGSATRGSWRYSIYVTDGTFSCKYDPWVDNT